MLPILEDVLSSKCVASLQAADVTVLAFDGWNSADGSYWMVTVFS